MRLGSLTLALGIALVAAAAHAAFTTAVAGGGIPCTLSPGGSCYEDFTANGVSWVSTSNCSDVKVGVISNIASASDHDAAVELYACPAGTTTASATLCRKIGYRNAAGVAVTVLDGDQSTGTEAVYGIVAHNLVVDVTTSSQTTRVQVDCR